MVGEPGLHSRSEGSSRNAPPIRPANTPDGRASAHQFWPNHARSSNSSQFGASGRARTVDLPAALVSITPRLLSQTKPSVVMNGPDTSPGASTLCPAGSADAASGQANIRTPTTSASRIEWAPRAEPWHPVPPGLGAMHTAPAPSWLRCSRRIGPFWRTALVDFSSETDITRANTDTPAREHCERQLAQRRGCAKDETHSSGALGSLLPFTEAGVSDAGEPQLSSARRRRRTDMERCLSRSFVA